jgi:WD40 repeat protein
MTTLTREPGNANATTLLITPTTLVCVGRGKLTSFVRYLEKDLGIENRFVDVEVLERSAERFFFLDLVQVAQASQDAVHWLKQRRCSIIAGCRIDGFDARRLGGLITVLLMRYDGFAWDKQGYAVLAAPAVTVGDILSRCDLPCLLQKELCASFEAVTLQPWPTLLEKREQDHEFPLEPGIQLFPLSWSLDGKEVVCGLRDYVPTDERVRRRVLLVGRVTGQGELRHGLDLGVLNASSAWKRVVGEDITICSISPDGELLALVLASKTVLFDRVEQQVVRVIPAAGNPVLWSPDSSKIALCLTMHYDPRKATLENQVEIWDIFSHMRHPWLIYDGHHAEQFEQRVSEHLRTASWSPDGRLVVTAGNTTGMSATAHVWDAATGALRFVYRGHQERVTTVAFAPASSPDPLVASIGDDHTVQVWHALTGECVFHARSNIASFKKGWVYENHVAWSPDGQHIAFQTADDELAIAHVRTGQVKGVCSLVPYALLDVAFSPDGTRLATLEVNFAAEEEDVLYCLCIRPIELQDA